MKINYISVHFGDKFRQYKNQKSIAIDVWKDGHLEIIIDGLLVAYFAVGSWDYYEIFYKE